MFGVMSGRSRPPDRWKRERSRSIQPSARLPQHHRVGRRRREQRRSLLLGLLVRRVAVVVSGSNGSGNGVGSDVADTIDRTAPSASR